MIHGANVYAEELARVAAKKLNKNPNSKTGLLLREAETCIRGLLEDRERTSPPSMSV